MNEIFQKPIRVSKHLPTHCIICNADRHIATKSISPQIKCNLFTNYSILLPWDQKHCPVHDIVPVCPGLAFQPEKLMDVTQDNEGLSYYHETLHLIQYHCIQQQPQIAEVKTEKNSRVTFENSSADEIKSFSRFTRTQVMEVSI